MTVVDQAENVGGIVSAARLRESFMRQRANAPDEERREALGDAIGTLEMRFPELEDLPAGGAEAFARERGHGRGSRSPSHEGRTRPGAAKRRRPDAAPLEQAARGTGTPKRERRRAGSSEARPAAAKASRVDRTTDRIERRGRQAYRETGIPAAGASISSIVMSALGATVGLGATYLLLTSAERGGGAGRALPQMLEAITGFVNRVIAPVDLFGHSLAPVQLRGALAAPGTPTREAGELFDSLPRLTPHDRHKQTGGLGYAVRHLPPPAKISAPAGSSSSPAKPQPQDAPLHSWSRKQLIAWLSRRRGMTPAEATRIWTHLSRGELLAHVRMDKNSHFKG